MAAAGRCGVDDSVCRHDRNAPTGARPNRPLHSNGLRDRTSSSRRRSSETVTGAPEPVARRSERAWFASSLRLVLGLSFAAVPVGAATIFQDGFELGLGSWSADNGLRELGTPTAGPGGCY